MCILGLSTGCFSQASAEDSADIAVKYQEPAPCITPEQAERIADQVAELVNLERTSADDSVSPVSINPTLSKIASDYACRMIEEGFFAHYDPINGYGPRDRAIMG